jgi:hypothetical protein
VRIGRHQLSLPIAGAPAEWLGALRHALTIAAEVEGGTRTVQEVGA